MTNASGIGRAYAWIAFVEAFTWAGLLVGMFLKYITETTPIVVTIFGSLHGAAFITYGLITIAAAIRMRWSWFVALLALAASIPPLCTIPMEIWLRRTGRLAAAEPAAAPAVA
ncbi:DUF3817 domain-containing protein [Leucobacter chromiiresistens]|uniref:Integral membrane protein n=1 Tax=Leucobacter chromiiresistens TaxID=1079994 RepID=A0A1H0Y2J0_9MICO|nr:DUF3817 domain-containing protein [Leucobacter chromiiresistens]SDQ09377.1 integral membrane protein [Leucobacter chromiiresistens]